MLINTSTLLQKHNENQCLKALKRRMGLASFSFEEMLSRATFAAAPGLLPPTGEPWGDADTSFTKATPLQPPKSPLGMLHMQGIEATVNLSKEQHNSSTSFSLKINIIHL